jgi:hypothetical protein
VDDEDTIAKIRDLLQRLDKPPHSLFTLKCVRDQAFILLSDRLGGDRRLARDYQTHRDPSDVEPERVRVATFMSELDFANQVRDVRLPRLFGSKGSAAVHRARLALTRILQNAMFTLELYRVPGLPGEAPAEFPRLETREQLVAMLAGVLEEVEKSDLSEKDKDQLRYVLEQARIIVGKSADPNSARRGLELIIGQAVSRAARPGKANRFWKRTAEVVLPSNATLSLGTGLAGLVGPHAAQLEVTCVLEPPALNPGPPASEDGLGVAPKDEVGVAGSLDAPSEGNCN